MLLCKHLTDLAADADSGDMLKTAFEGEKAPVTLLNFVSAPEAWQPSKKELNQAGAALLHSELKRTTSAACLDKLEAQQVVSLLAPCAAVWKSHDHGMVASFLRTMCSVSRRCCANTTSACILRP